MEKKKKKYKKTGRPVFALETSITLRARGDIELKMKEKKKNTRESVLGRGARGGAAHVSSIYDKN